MGEGRATKSGAIISNLGVLDRNVGRPVKNFEFQNLVEIVKMPKSTVLLRCLLLYFTVFHPYNVTHFIECLGTLRKIFSPKLIRSIIKVFNNIFVPNSV